MKRDKPTSEQTLPPVAQLVSEKKNSLFRYIDLDGQEQELNFRSLVDADPSVIPMPVDREGYSPVEHSDRYWATGHGDLLNVQSALERFGKLKNQKLFDFGCSTGRFLRHVHYFTQMQAHGCDFAPANVNWAAEHLPAAIKIVLNSTNPELPYSDETFEVVTAFSVFTHIDAGELEWLNELTRITRTGGLLYLTIQNQSSWNRVVERPGMLDHLKRANQIEGNLRVDENLFAAKLPTDRIVFKMSSAEIYNCNVWTTNKYVEEHWTDSLELLQIFENAHNSFQSVVLLRRK